MAEDMEQVMDTAVNSMMAQIRMIDEQIHTMQEAKADLQHSLLAMVATNMKKDSIRKKYLSIIKKAITWNKHS